MTVTKDVTALTPVARIEMFEWDASIITGNPADLLRWHPGTTITNAPITWQGLIYNPLPIEASGFERNAQGTLPRPTLRASNVVMGDLGSMGAYIRSIGGALGAKVTRKRTLGKYLDAVNFPGGNPYADPTTYFPDEVYYVSRKNSENAIWIEMELAVKFDLAGTKLPRRQVMASLCQWVYRGTECSYPKNAPIVNDPVYGMVDMCSKSLEACTARFGANGVLRTSAFPGAMLGKAQ